MGSSAEKLIALSLDVFELSRRPFFLRALFQSVILHVLQDFDRREGAIRIAII